MQTKKDKTAAPVHYKWMTFKQADIQARKVSGYLAAFGVKDSDSDILIKGCFSKSITERGPESDTNGKIAFLFQHNMKDPIGRFTTLKEDNFGLYFEGLLDEGVESSDRTLIQLKSGTLNQFSIGFQYVWDKLEYDEDTDAFIVKEVNLFEGSVVTLGAQSLTYFAGMKTEQREAAEAELIKETELFIKTLPKDQQYTTRQFITKHIALAIAQPVKPLKATDEPQNHKDTGLASCSNCLKTFNYDPSQQDVKCPGCGQYVKQQGNFIAPFDWSKALKETKFINI